MKDSPYALTRLLPRLWLGNFALAEDPPEHITALLNVAAERDLQAPDRLYHKIPIIDFQPIPVEQMKEAVLWIHQHIGQHSILLFCNAGVGRSPSVAIGYLCCFQGMGFGEAVEFVARKRPYISPLPGLILTIEKTRKELGLDSSFS